MKSLARRLAQRGGTLLACNDSWFALAALGAVLVPIVAIFAYW